MSASTTSAVPPAVLMSAARASRRSRQRATSATEAPCSANWRAVAAPIPLLAPVTRAVVPVSSDSMGDVLVPGSWLWVRRLGVTLGAGAIANDPGGGVLQVTALFLHEPQRGRSGQMTAADIILGAKWAGWQGL